MGLGVLVYRSIRKCVISRVLDVLDLLWMVKYRNWNIFGYEFSYLKIFDWIDLYIASVTIYKLKYKWNNELRIFWKFFHPLDSVKNTNYVYFIVGPRLNLQFSCSKDPSFASGNIKFFWRYIENVFYNSLSKRQDNKNLYFIEFSGSKDQN